MTETTVLVWLRQDLRLADHRALRAAVATGGPVLCAYILDEDTPGQWAPGGASKWWLHNSLAALKRSFAARGGALVLRRGRIARELPRLAGEARASAVYCSRAYEPWARQVETDLKAALAERQIAFKRFGGTLLMEPEDIATQAGEPFRVYTPFWRALSDRLENAAPLAAPERIPAPSKSPRSDSLADWKLLPSKPDWASGLRETWRPGEDTAHARLALFLDGALAGYKMGRDRPASPATSRLSPHLHFGEITPRQCWYAACAAAASQPKAETGLFTFLKEIAWREFSHHLLFHWPTLPDAAFRPEFERFAWVNDHERLLAWLKGRTGYPLVDAGMRELWRTGWMHNRVRMVAASFLIKHLMISWREGEAWFWDTLVDADLANNAASWQWVAGSGADAAPYFRIFNPVKQGETFDPSGAYVRRWVPELARLPDSLIHAPWLASSDELKKAKVKLGETYPSPIVEHAEARRRALAAYEEVRSG